MDCEKFDSLIIDELYGELDELTSAAMKRHASGCSECAEKLRGFKATREQAVLAEPDFPADLEERIFAATNEAQKVVPITASRSRLSRAVSLAGTWAMRPQTAMAALFLLMIGSSAVLLRSRQPKDSASLTVTQEGAPSPAAVAANDEKAEFETKSASAAHGPAGAQPATTPMATTKSAASTLALNESPAVQGDPAGNGLGRAGALGQGERRDEGKKGAGGSPGAAMDKVEPLGGALAAAPTMPAAPQAAAMPASPPPAAATKPKAAQSESRDRDDLSDPFQAGMAAYQGRRFAEATPKLDQAAAQGNTSASLWAARSVREGSGCAAAVARFNAVAAKGGAVGADATFDAARCYESMGDQNAARSRYTSLLAVPAYAARARAALDSSSEMASRKAEQQRAPAGPQATGNGNGQAGGARAAPARESAPKMPAPAAPSTANSL